MFIPDLTTDAKHSGEWSRAAGLVFAGRSGNEKNRSRSAIGVVREVGGNIV
ncbi:hypothetical protein [Pararhizobium sp.]|uniref:hypothetical protein n=1 Tax=Pararhizobium sp. TaxID=1977563 RepID=UPI003D0AE100